LLDALAKALQPDWKLTRVAGRVKQQVKILREVAHHLSPKPDREDRPANAAQAETQLWDYLTQLQRETPRRGLSAKMAQFVDALVQRVGRYGVHLYCCFEDARIPATTNGLEGYFGLGKRMVRKAVGAGSTSNSVVTNLGEEVLVTLQQVRRAGRGMEFAVPVDQSAYRKARADLEKMEQPARLRRSQARDPGKYIRNLTERWDASS
jgi:hypothetical protein